MPLDNSGSGLLANRPAPGPYNNGKLYTATDTGQVFISTGTGGVWIELTESGGGGSSAQKAADATITQLVREDDPNITDLVLVQLLKPDASPVDERISVVLWASVDAAGDEIIPEPDTIRASPITPAFGTALTANPYEFARTFVSDAQGRVELQLRSEVSPFDAFVHVILPDGSVVSSASAFTVEPHG